MLFKSFFFLMFGFLFLQIILDFVDDTLLDYYILLSKHILSMCVSHQ